MFLLFQLYIVFFFFLGSLLNMEKEHPPELNHFCSEMALMRAAKASGESLIGRKSITPTVENKQSHKNNVVQYSFRIDFTLLF